MVGVGLAVGISACGSSRQPSRDAGAGDGGVEDAGLGPCEGVCFDWRPRLDAIDGCSRVAGHAPEACRRLPDCDPHGTHADGCPDGFVCGDALRRSRAAAAAHPACEPTPGATTGRFLWDLDLTPPTPPADAVDVALEVRVNGGDGSGAGWTSGLHIRPVEGGLARWVGDVPADSVTELRLAVGDYDVDVRSGDASAGAGPDTGSRGARRGLLRVRGAGRAALDLEVARVRFEPRVTGATDRLLFTADLRGRHGERGGVARVDGPREVLVPAGAYTLEATLSTWPGDVLITRPGLVVEHGPEDVVLRAGETRVLAFDVTPRVVEVDVTIEGAAPPGRTRRVYLAPQRGGWWSEAQAQSDGRVLAAVPTAAGRSGPMELRVGDWHDAPHVVATVPADARRATAVARFGVARFDVDTGAAPRPPGLEVGLAAPGRAPFEPWSPEGDVPVRVDAAYDVWLADDVRAWRALAGARLAGRRASLSMPLSRVRVTLSLDGRPVGYRASGHLDLHVGERLPGVVFQAPRLPYVDGAFEAWLTPGEHTLYVTGDGGEAAHGGTRLGAVTVVASRDVDVAFDVPVVDVEVAVSAHGRPAPAGELRGWLWHEPSPSPGDPPLEEGRAATPLPTSGEPRASVRLLGGVYDLSYGLTELPPGVTAPIATTNVWLR